VLVLLGPLQGGPQDSLEKLGPLNDPNEEKGETMNDQTRVLIRQGSRELSPEEVEQVGGGFNTLSITWGPNGRDGDGLLGDS
jgi:hypothetical protein